MKILNICMRAPFTEGYTYQDNLLSEYQQKLGHEVTVLTSTIKRGVGGKIIECLPEDKTLSNGVRLIRIKPGNKLQQVFGYYPDISRILDIICPDLIFIHGLCQFVPLHAIRYKRRHSEIALKADNHQDNQNCKTTGFPFHQIMWLWKTCWKFWIKHFNVIFGTTSWRRDFAIEYYGIPKEKAKILRMGTDSDILPSNPINVRNMVRSELGLTDREFVFIHGGKMDDKKLTIEIMKAFSLIKNPGIRLLLFGSVDSVIREHFDSILKSDIRIKHIGYIDSNIIHRYFYASDFGLFPGGHSVLWEESIGCGLPGLFRQYGNADHTNICGNALSIQPNASSEEIAKIMQTVYTNTTLYNRLKSSAIKAAPLFSYRHIAQQSID